MCAAVNIADLRREYQRASLTEADVDPDPLRQFRRWLHESVQAELPRPTVPGAPGRVGLAAEQRDSRPRMARAGIGGGARAFRSTRRTRTAPDALGRLSHRADLCRVLARPRVALARSPPVPARGRALAARAPRAVS